jgi:DNA-directed RNA polymerase II subunit RPB2
MSREPMIAWLRRNAVLKLIEELAPLQLSIMTKVFVNGYWCGAIEDPFMCCEKFKLFRRNALIPIHASISFDIKQNTILIYTDAGRLCRPIFYRDESTHDFSVEIYEKNRKKMAGGWSEFITGFHDKKAPDFTPNHTQIYELSDLYDGIDGESNPAKQAKFIENKAIIDYLANPLSALETPPDLTLLQVSAAGHLEQACVTLAKLSRLLRLLPPVSVSSQVKYLGV